ncbi:MAG: PDZ domain-containing protein, partial [Bacteroidetes bacterium]|nr:PDZ domain-containing protein [Bacteroidota bacterium]
MRLVFSILCVLPFLANANFYLTKEVGIKVNEAYGSIKPIIQTWINDDFEDASKMFSSLQESFDFAMKHKETGGYLYLKILPNDKSDEAQIRVDHAKIFGATATMSEPNTKFTRAMRDDYNNTSTVSIDISGCSNWTNKSNGKFYSITHNEHGTFEFYWFYDDLGEHEKAFRRINEAFRFKEAPGFFDNQLGIGVAYDFNFLKNMYVINNIVKDLPSHQKGLMPGDVIEKVGWAIIAEQDKERVKELIMGDEGTSVQLTIIRSGYRIVYDLKRQALPVKIDVVEYDEIDNLAFQIGYLAKELTKTLPIEIKGESISSSYGVKYKLTKKAPQKTDIGFLDKIEGIYYLRSEEGESKESYIYKVFETKDEVEIKLLYQYLIDDLNST